MARRAPSCLRQRERRIVRAQHVRRARTSRLVRKPAKERLAGKIQMQTCPLTAQRKQNPRVRVVGVHIRTRASLVRQTIANGILYLQRRVMSIAQVVVHAACRHCDGRTAPQHAFPGQRIGFVIQIVCIAAGETPQQRKHTACQARPQAHAFRVRRRALKRHAALQPAHARRSQRAQLLGKRRLKTLGTAGVKLHVKPLAASVVSPL